MIVHECLQGSEQWHTFRKGRPTASRFKDIIQPSTGDLSKNKKGDGLSEKTKAYIAELIGECFVPDWVDFAGNKFTDRGNDLEPEARKAFSHYYGGCPVEQVGFCTRDDGVVGCSPDGLIRGPDGEYLAGLELKCPSPKVHIGWMMDGILPAEHHIQVHGSMAVTGLNTWHFFSHFPGLKPFHYVAKRDDFTERLSAALDEFVVAYAETREKLIPKLKSNE
jgi:hypothetical protein